MDRQFESKGTQVDSTSPIQDRKRKIAKTLQTAAAVHTRGETNILYAAVNTHEITPNSRVLTEPLVEPNEWEFAKNRKKKKKKILNKRQPAFQVQGEAITIKASTSETYADVIKQMKNKIDPTEIGVEIKGIRRTKTGELLVNFKKGDGQAEKLRKALGNMLGDDVTEGLHARPRCARRWSGSSI